MTTEMKTAVRLVTRLIPAILVIIILLLSLNSHLTSSVLGSENTYYISTTGSDTNSGTYSSPFRTFSKATSVLTAGDRLLVFGGTYYDKISITKSGLEGKEIEISSVDDSKVILNADTLNSTGVYIGGNYITIENLEVLNADGVGVDVKGSNIELKNLKVSGSVSHGVNFRGINASMEDSEISGNVLENEGNKGKWGSGVKVSMGGNHITIKNNKVTKNWGEGIATTRGANIDIEGNFVQDNFSANIYIDNSYTVNVYKNFVTCTPNSGFERDGQRAKGIMIGEEAYDGWGSKLNHVNIVNNITAYCYRGISYYSAEVTNAGLRNSVIAFNTLYGNISHSLYIADFPETANSIIANNIVEQPSGKLSYIEDPTGLVFYNNFWMNGQPSINAAGENDKSGDVKFAKKPNYTTSSFELLEGSPAINSGANISSIQNDFSGNPRVIGDVADIGAIEYQQVITSEPVPPIDPVPPVMPKCPPLPKEYCLNVSTPEEPATPDPQPILDPIQNPPTAPVPVKIEKVEVKEVNEENEENTVISDEAEETKEIEKIKKEPEIIVMEETPPQIQKVSSKSNVLAFGSLSLAVLTSLKFLLKFLI